MCFRPTSVSGAQKCPHCGEELQAVNGILPKRCPFCRNDIAAAAAPGAPAAPSAPGAPAALSAPAAPKPPTP